MDVIDAIKRRRSIGLVEDREVPEDVIEKLLDAAIWAPNHRKTEPWKFRVFTGQARVKLGNEMARIMEKKTKELAKEEAKKKIEKVRVGPLRAPVIITLAVSPSGKVPEIEEVTACGCAIQNLLLAATSMGLATYVRTGEIAFEKELNKYLQLEEKDHILGFIYVGYPKKDILIEAKRTPAREKTVWYKD